MRSSDHESLCEMLLADLTFDWVCAAWIDGVARRLVADVADRRALSIGIVGQAMLAGDVEAGLVESGTFEAFADSSPAVLSMVATEWLALGELPPPLNSVCWFRCTQQGLEKGKGVIAELTRSGRVIDEEFGDGSLSAMRAALRDTPSSIADLAAELTDHRLSAPDQYALKLGLLIEAVGSGAVRVEGRAATLVEAIEAFCGEDEVRLVST